MGSPAITRRPEDDSPKSAREKEREEEFREAVRRVYEHYGNNLAAFLRDIKKEKELTKKG